VLDIGEKEKVYMKKNRKNDKPVGNLTQVADFLPEPSKLVPKEHLTKITLTVDDETVLFFKSKAKSLGTKYQKMMREVLKHYAGHFKKSA
jgi:predicted DNA binding CopG/RHH family protein